jgi:hypothetical protein
MLLIKDISQGSEEWFKEKLGKPSASNASKIITNEGKKSKQREGYLYQLAAEIITGKREETYQNQNMIDGIEREQESREFYELINGVEVEQVGVVYKDEKKQFLCSPDGIVNNSYGLELKNVLPKTQVKYLLNNRLPSEYFSQVQFSLYVTGFKFWDFVSYAPEIKPLIVRVFPDNNFIALLAEALHLFCCDLDRIVEKVT